MNDNDEYNRVAPGFATFMGWLVAIYLIMMALAGLAAVGGMIAAADRHSGYTDIDD